MCHIGFLCLALSTLLSHHECFSHCVPALPHSSFVLSFFVSPCLFFKFTSFAVPFFFHLLLFTSSFVCSFFFLLLLLFPLLLPSFPPCSCSLYVCVHMCVYSSLSSLAGGSVESVSLLRAVMCVICFKAYSWLQLYSTEVLFMLLRCSKNTHSQVCWLTQTWTARWWKF